MIIYAEIVFLSNFFIDAFIFCITLVLQKSPINVLRIIVASTLGGLASAIIPIVPKYNALIKIIGIFIFPLLIKKSTKITGYLSNTATFLTVTLIMGGGAYLLINSGYSEYVLLYGVFPIVASFSGIMLIILARYLQKFALSERNKNKNIYEVELFSENNRLRLYAYFDSGNRVYANNGEPVTVVSETVYNVFDSVEDSIFVSSINGVSELRTKEVFVKIILDDGAEKVYETKIAKAPRLIEDFDVILHCDMLGG